MKTKLQALTPYLVMGMMILAAIVTQSCKAGRVPRNLPMIALQQGEQRYHSTIKQRAFKFKQGRAVSLVDKKSK